MLLLVILVYFFSKSGVGKQEAIPPGAIFIDVTSPGEFSGGSIHGALNIPVADISKRENEISKVLSADKSKPIVVFCASGIRSKMAQATLIKNGYTRVVNGGGFSQLRKRV